MGGDREKKIQSVKQGGIEKKALKNPNRRALSEKRKEKYEGRGRGALQGGVVSNQKVLEPGRHVLGREIEMEGGDKRENKCPKPHGEKGNSVKKTTKNREQKGSL